MTTQKPYQRTRNLFDPASDKPYKISRSKLELYMRCPRCFYLDRRLGISQPSGFPFNLNSAVDALLKKEFDIYRKNKTPHPLMVENHIQAIPYQHSELDRWRDSLHHGIQYAMRDIPIILTGGIDDVWQHTATDELIIVDYKATSKTLAVSIDADWQIGYKRQAEVYQWLFRQNGFRVSNTAYFVYCNGLTHTERFDNKLRFDISLIPYEGNDAWVDAIVHQAYRLLCEETIPKRYETCDFCQYTAAIRMLQS